MKITKISMFDTVYISDAIVACIGYFDGLHKGHQALINKTNELAFKLNAKRVMISFYPDPWVITKKLDVKDIKHIHDYKTKVKLLEKYGIDELIILQFNSEMACLTSKDFTEFIYSKINLKALVVGFDFHYGYRGQGDYNSLINEANQRFEVHKIDEILDNNEKISSSRIDMELKRGNVTEVNRLLGHLYVINGVVIDGKKQGRRIGFPTANIDYSKEILLPGSGVYSGYVKVLDIYYLAMINVGHNPTFNESIPTSVEVHILDFNETIYGQQLEVYFERYLRPEIKFNTIEELIRQMELDKRMIIEYKSYE